MASKLSRALSNRAETLALEDPLFWFTEFCFTYDPNGAIGERVLHYPNVYYQNRPDYCAPLAAFISVIHQYTQIAVPKSRQIMASWTAVGYFTWVAIVEPMSYIMFQSRTETMAGRSAVGDAARRKWNKKPPSLGLLDRVDTIFANMPSRFGLSSSEASKPPKFILSNGSTIHAVCQDGSAFRQYTATHVLADELAFQENALTAYTAAQPTLGRNSKYVALSSVNGRDPLFYGLCHDQMPGARA